MYITNNSMELYRELQNNRAQYPYFGNTGFEDTMMWYYVDLIKTMFYELIVSGQSDLLSWLCIGNQIGYRPEYFSFSANRTEHRSNYDVYPIVQSLRSFFQNDIRTCCMAYTYNKHYLFSNFPLPLEKCNEQILQCLADIDAAVRDLKGVQQAAEMTRRCERQKEQILSQEQRLEEQKRQLAEQKRQLAAQEQQLVEQRRQPAAAEQPPAAREEQLTEQEPAAERQDFAEEEPPSEQKLKSAGLTQQISRAEETHATEQLPLSEKLQTFAGSRQREDADLLRRIQQLQVDLQSELQEIAKIREGLEYETLREPISQILAMHDLLWDILESHPSQDSAAGYVNLIDSCRDLRENIVEALAVLGVTYINEAEVPFAPDRHRAAPGIQPTRNAMITKVLRPGFIYRSKTLEKAIVELQ